MKDEHKFKNHPICFLTVFQSLLDNCGLRLPCNLVRKKKSPSGDSNVESLNLSAKIETKGGTFIYKTCPFEVSFKANREAEEMNAVEVRGETIKKLQEAILKIERAMWQKLDLKIE